MEDFEIISLFKDEYGSISHCSVKGYGVQPIVILENLIKKNICSFFAYDKHTKIDVYTLNPPKGRISYTDKSNEPELIALDFLPRYDISHLRQLIKSVH